ncbi:MAG: site-specific DNA-methyltransferase, partial [Ruminiclostridium sp.]|nr:site-specific DNA-methyltransferase [Ruminiclostridium sp.]
ADDYAEESGQLDEDGNRLFKNTDSKGIFHSDWCSMIYSRLMLARNLLADDGVIFISIDENEVENLKKICNEVMGVSNFLAQIITISNPGGRDYKQVAIMHEYVLIYGKSDNTELYEIEKECNFEKYDANGGYELRELRNRNPKFHRGNRPNLFFPIYVNPNVKDEYDCCAVSLTQDENYSIEVCPYNSTGVESVWRWGKPKVLSNIMDTINYSNVVAKQKIDGNYNIYEKCRKSTSKVKSLWNETEMRNEDGTRLVRSLFDKTFFDHPKPIALLKRCLYLSTDEESIILDFFSGSATTAHAVMQLNAEDGGHRKFIMVQLPEETAEDSDAHKAGYKNICEIGKERIRRAGAKIKSETSADIDYGFRVLKLDETNMEDVYYTPAETTQQTLFDLVSNIKSDRNDLDLLFGCLLDWGLPLSMPYKSEQIEGVTVHTYNDGDLIACFDSDISEEAIRTIAKRQPLRVVFRDDSFANSPSKINVSEIFKMLSPDTRIKVI